MLLTAHVLAKGTKKLFLKRLKTQNMETINLMVKASIGSKYNVQYNLI